MPFVYSNGVAIHWELAGPPSGPALVLLNSIGTGMESWDDCIPALAEKFRLLQIDTRGHGASEAPEGDYSLDALAGDIVAVMDAAGVVDAAIAGVSLGGMIAMQLALSFPQRATALILICTSATMDAAVWSERIATVRAEGIGAIAEMAIGRFFSPEFVSQKPERVEKIRRAMIDMSAAGYAGSGAAIRDMKIIDRLGKISLPTLIIAGQRDISTPFGLHGKAIAEAIPGALTAYVDAAHLAQIEAPEAVSRLIVDLLGG